MKLHPDFIRTNHGSSESELFEIGKEMLAPGQTLDCECDNCAKLYNRMYLHCACVICGGEIVTLQLNKSEPCDLCGSYGPSCKCEPEYCQER